MESRRETTEKELFAAVDAANESINQGMGELEKDIDSQEKQLQFIEKSRLLLDERIASTDKRIKKSLQKSSLLLGNIPNEILYELSQASQKALRVTESYPSHEFFKHALNDLTAFINKILINPESLRLEKIPASKLAEETINFLNQINKPGCEWPKAITQYEQKCNEILPIYEGKFSPFIQDIIHAAIGCFIGALIGGLVGFSLMTIPLPIIILTLAGGLTGAFIGFSG